MSTFDFGHIILQPYLAGWNGGMSGKPSQHGREAPPTYCDHQAHKKSTCLM